MILQILWLMILVWLSIGLLNRSRTWLSHLDDLLLHVIFILLFSSGIDLHLHKLSIPPILPAKTDDEQNQDNSQHNERNCPERKLNFVVMVTTVFLRTLSGFIRTTTIVVAASSGAGQLSAILVAHDKKL